MINEKLELLSLPEEEKKKAYKFLAALSLVSVDELKDILTLLQKNGISISKAREIKVLANTKEEISKKFDILGQIGELGFYKQNPTRISSNVIDVYKKIQYCKQIGKAYKKEDGSYESFLFDELKWQEVSKVQNEQVISSEPEVVTMAPETAPMSAQELIDDNVHQDIQEYMANDRNKEEAVEQTTTFDVIQDELETQKLESDISKLVEDKEALLDFQKQLSELDTISFNDLDFETESFGGR